eukprot:GHRQ01031844.1.p1 GENE.GHRQ01031844.1~~GHRQ01031844.1.p1  ORF type:complete len:114 (+),score=21.52 GHRQ01031844.1:441-782(+)
MYWKVTLMLACLCICWIVTCTSHDAPYALQDLKFPLLENKNEWHIHGYAYGNYLTELNPPGQVFAKGASLDKAFEGGQVRHNAAPLLLQQRPAIYRRANICVGMHLSTNSTGH